MGRAVLLHKGRVLGDALLADLEEEGKTLMDYVKESYRYRPDRVSQALSQLANEKEGN